jgi:hypothetical protein
MGEVRHLAREVAASQSRAWEAYCAASRKAQASGLMDDGIEAGRCWKRWLDLFVTSDQRARLDAAVLPMVKRK